MKGVGINKSIMIHEKGMLENIKYTGKNIDVMLYHRYPKVLSKMVLFNSNENKIIITIFCLMVIDLSGKLDQDIFQNQHIKTRGNVLYIYTSIVYPTKSFMNISGTNGLRSTLILKKNIKRNNVISNGYFSIFEILTQSSEDKVIIKIPIIYNKPLTIHREKKDKLEKNK